LLIDLSAGRYLDRGTVIRETIQLAMSTHGWLPVASRASAALLLTVASGFADAPTSQNAVRRIQTIRSVTVTPSKDGATVVIEASGPLAQPSSGLANDPPRIYIDFIDVLPGQPIQPVSENPYVRRVRVAEHNATPLITRVVIDLTRKATYRIDSSTAQQGRVTVSLEVAGDPIDVPQHSAARPSTPATTQTATPVAPGQAATEQVYDVRISAALVRLHALRPLLESIDRQADPLAGNLDAAVGEFEAIGKILSGIKAPRSREATHALLQRTCTMGVRAIRTRQDGARTNDPAATLNAASAAAGALLMLDRANKELVGAGK
jgi:hypothetical protein